MNRRTRILLGISAVVLLAAAAAILGARLTRDTVLELRVRDAVSHRWVWDLTLRMQDRELRGFYQSDTALRTFRFTHLRPGPATLQLSAPGYQALSVPVMLRRGNNRLAAPVDMAGREIPGLGGFLMFETLDGNDIVVQVRPVEKDGAPILNHPCIDLWVSCRVFAQLPTSAVGGGGGPAPGRPNATADRGRELFRGRIPWTWDPSPEATFRYSARISGARMKDDPSGLRIIDYLVVVPDPTKITRSELDALMARVETRDDPAAVGAALDEEKDRLRWFTDTSLNVKVTQE
jgi:hypothetical protein